MHHLDRLEAICLRQQQAERESRLERSQLVREARKAALAQQRVRFYQPMLISLGKRMVIWGTQLQHLAPAPEIEVSFAAQPK